MAECGTVSQYTNGGCRCDLCKESWRVYRNEYRQKNKDAANSYGREYYQKNKVAMLASDKEYYQKNRQKRIDASSKWNKENKERHNEHARTKNNRRRAAKSIKFTVEQLAGRLDYWGRKCYLKLEGCTGEYKHLDHVIPLSRGGLHALSNLRPACQSCNLRKGNKLLKELV